MFKTEKLKPERAKWKPERNKFLKDIKVSIGMMT